MYTKNDFTTGELQTINGLKTTISKYFLALINCILLYMSFFQCWVQFHVLPWQQMLIILSDRNPYLEEFTDKAMIMML